MSTSHATASTLSGSSVTPSSLDSNRVRNQTYRGPIHIAQLLSRTTIIPMDRCTVHQQSQLVACITPSLRSPTPGIYCHRRIMTRVLHRLHNNSNLNRTCFALPPTICLSSMSHDRVENANNLIWLERTKAARRGNRALEQVSTHLRKP
jgi:hypothetical protein